MLNLRATVIRIGLWAALSACAAGPPRGGVFVLSAPSGTGKSTLFRMIMGEEHADDGVVSIPKKLSARRRRCGSFVWPGECLADAQATPKTLSTPIHNTPVRTLCFVIIGFLLFAIPMYRLV